MRQIPSEVWQGAVVTFVLFLTASCGRIGYDPLAGAGSLDGGRDGSPMDGSPMDGSSMDGSSMDASGMDGGQSSVAGTLDPAFGTSGRFAFPMANLNDVVVDPAGQILVVGRTNQNTFAFRLHSNGTLDDSFNGNGDGTVTGSEGTVEFDLTGGNNDTATGVAVDAGGTITMAGHGSVGGRQQGILVRLNADGSLDDSYNGNGDGNVTAGEGYRVESMGIWNYYRTPLLVGAGDVLGVGGLYSNAPRSDLRVRHYDANGVLQEMLEPFGHELREISATLVGSGWGYLTGGRDVGGSNEDFAVARINVSTVTYDTSFGSGGTRRFSFGFPVEGTFDIAEASSGSRLYLGATVANTNGVDNQPVVIAIGLDGSLDSAFDGDGWVTLPSMTAQVVTDFVPTDDGGGLAVIRVPGDLAVGPMGVARLRADGSLDPCFGDSMCLAGGVVWLSGGYSAGGGATRAGDRLYVVGDRDTGGPVGVGEVISIRL